jgi:long-subunit acyl-CoA synthetase (AMP-forming)
MNLSLIQQIMKSGNPQQAILNMMTPQQRQLAQAFLNNPNREQALQDLMKQNGVSKEQIEQVTKVISS